MHQKELKKDKFSYNLIIDFFKRNYLSAIMRFFKSLIRAYIFRINTPFLVQFSITNRCNYRCKYCYAHYYKRPQEDLSFEKIKLIIDELVKHGMLRLNLVGGEPLIRKDIGDIVNYAKSKKIHVAMTTNGSLLTNKIEEIKNIDMICFSLDGQKNNNDLYRGDGAFDNVIKGLELCKKYKIQTQLSAVLNKHTVDDVEYLVSLAEKYSSKVGFTLLISQEKENKTGNHSLLPDNGKLENALKKIIEMQTSGKPILFSKKTYQYSLNWPNYDQNVALKKISHFKNISCKAGKYFFIIDYNGDIYPCPQLVGIFKPLNILKDGLYKAMKQASRKKCAACSIPCSNEFSMFFNLDPFVIKEYL